MPPPKYPSKGWCWHREAKLLSDPVDVRDQLIVYGVALQKAIWYCPHCQNYAQLVKA